MFKGLAWTLDQTSVDRNRLQDVLSIRRNARDTATGFWICG